MTVNFLLTVTAWEFPIQFCFFVPTRKWFSQLHFHFQLICCSLTALQYEVHAAIATDGVAWSDGLSRLWALQKRTNRSSCRFSCGLGCAQGTMYYRGAHWRYLANMTEPSMCGGDPALCQITLTTCSYYDREVCPATSTFDLHIDRVKVNLHA